MIRANRPREAALGFGVTVVPLLAVGCLQFLLAPTIVERAGFNSETESWVTTQYRDGIVSGYTWISAIVFTYWMVALTLGRGKILAIKSANVTLGASVLIFALAMATASIFPEPSLLFKWSCPMLGHADSLSGFGFDGQTPCEAFAYMAANAVLLGLPLLFLATSAILRVAVSRRTWKHSVR